MKLQLWIENKVLLQQFFFSKKKRTIEWFWHHGIDLFFTIDNSKY